MHGLRFALVIALTGCVTTVLGQDSDLIIEVTLSVACDRKTHKGDIISVGYNGTFTNGTEFDSSAYPRLPRVWDLLLLTPSQAMARTRKGLLASTSEQARSLKGS